MQSHNYTSLATNTLVHERYLVVRTIGRGGMGAVYEAVDQRLGATVALKQMTVSGANVAAAFEREARILAGLRHPSLPKVSDFFSDGYGQFLVMEYIPGTDLGTLLAQRGRPFPVEDVLRWADQCLAVLEYLHVQSPPIIHRDIKPQNMKLTPAGEIVLLDFGLAKGYAATQAATTGSIFAYTPNYAPLEQVQGAGTTPASDLYALAATLYHLLTGAPPPDVLQRLGGAASGQADPLRPANELNPLVPAAVAQWLSHGLQLDQRGRPASAATMRAALKQLQPGAPAAVANLGPTLLAGPPPATAAAPAAATEPPPARRRPSGPVLFLIAALAVLLLGGGALAAILLRGDDQPGQAIAPTATAGSAAVALAAPTEPPPTAAPTEPPPTEPPPTEPPPTAAPPTAPPTEDRAPTAIAAQISGPQFGPSGPQRPARVSASGTAPAGVDSAGNPISYDPQNAADGQSDTAWRVPGNGVGQFVQLDLAGPTRISQVQLIPGYAKIDQNDGTDRFRQNRRVTRARLEFSDGSSVEATFGDTPTLQAVPLPQPAISTYVRVVILATSEPGANGGRDFTPISEIVIIGEAQL